VNYLTIIFCSSCVIPQNHRQYHVFFIDDRNLVLVGWRLAGLFFVQAESKSSPVWLPIILGQTGLFLQQSTLGYHQSFLKTRGIGDAQVD
jgi:hypothetical protein